MREKVCMEKCVHTGRYITILNLKVQRQTAKGNREHSSVAFSAYFSLFLFAVVMELTSMA